MKGSFKPLLKRIKMRDSREGMLFMNPNYGMCRVKGILDITGIDDEYSYAVRSETVKNGHRDAYFAHHIWIAIGWVSDGTVVRNDERIMKALNIYMETELASMIRRCSQYKENTSRGVYGDSAGSICRYWPGGILH